MTPLKTPPPRRICLRISPGGRISTKTFFHAGMGFLKRADDVTHRHELIARQVEHQIRPRNLLNGLDALGGDFSIFDNPEIDRLAGRNLDFLRRASRT